MLSKYRPLLAWRPGALARNTLHASAWNVVRTASQAITVVLLARAFGPSGYGALAGTVGIFMTCAPLVGVGTGTALIRHVAHGGDALEMLRAIHRVYWLTSLVLIAVVLPLSYLWLGAALDPVAMAVLAFAELLLAPAFLPQVYRALADERLGVSGALQSVAPGARLCAALIAWSLGLSLTAFAWVYLLCLCIALLLVVAPTIARHGMLTPSRSHTVWDAIRDGWRYAVGGAAVTAGTELDKTIILRSAGSVAAGEYAAAYRVVQAATLPVNSLVLAVTPRLFKTARFHEGDHPRILVTVATVYAVVAAAGVWLAAPLLPLVFGHAFEASVGVLRWMCLLLVSSSLRQIVVAQLTSAHRQTARNLIEGGIAIATILSMLVIVPMHGVLGAVAVLVAADLLAAAMSWVALRRRIGDAATGHA